MYVSIALLRTFPRFFVMARANRKAAAYPSPHSGAAEAARKQDEIIEIRQLAALPVRHQYACNPAAATERDHRSGGGKCTDSEHFGKTTDLSGFRIDRHHRLTRADDVIEQANLTWQCGVIPVERITKTGAAPDEIFLDHQHSATLKVLGGQLQQR